MLEVTEIAFTCYPVTAARARAFYEGAPGFLKPTMVVGEPGGMQRTDTIAAL